MIKCNVTIIGTISRNGESRTDKEGRPYSTFGIQSVIKAKSGEGVSKRRTLFFLSLSSNPFGYAAKFA